MTTLAVVIRGLHHTSRTVTNLERSLGFYRDLLCLDVVSDEELHGESVERVVGLEGARLRVVELALGDGRLLELIEYRHPRGAQQPVSTTPADVGAHHMALLVDDVDAAYATLSAAGVRFTTGPQEISGGLFAGARTTYCFDPDGLPVELWHAPHLHHVPITTVGEKA
jgi:catechol 2,3-dioxygenase-like lactoylglutathione lyase family enzyme